MAKAYRRLLAAVPTKQQAIRMEQRAWLANMGRKCRAGGPQSMDACLSRLYSFRTEEIRRSLENHEDVKFLWHSIHLVHPDDPGTAKRDSEIGRAAYSTYDATWPEAVSDAPEWAAWNSAVASAVRNAIPVPSGRPGDKWPVDWADDADTDTKSEIHLVMPELVAVSVSNFWDGHGAHPNTTVIQFNWLLKERRELKSEDVFRADSGWKSALYTRVDAYLHKTLDSEGREYQNWFKGPDEAEKAVRNVIESPRNWRIDANGMTIGFPAYSVACYACTPPPFLLTWSELRPWVNPGFPVPNQVTPPGKPAPAN